MKLLVGALSILAPGLVAVSAEPGSIMPDKDLAFFEQYCFECRDDTLTKGGLNLKRTRFDLSDSKSRDPRWIQIFDHV